MEAHGSLFIITSVMSIILIHLKTVVTGQCALYNGLFRDPPPQFPDFMDAFRNTISRIGIENLLPPPPDGRGSSSSPSSSVSSSCPQSVNWSEFNSRLCAGDPVDLDGFCESLWTTADPDDGDDDNDAAVTSHHDDATSSFDVETDSTWSTTTSPDHHRRRQTSTILISDVLSTHQQRVDNFTAGSLDAVTPSSAFSSAYTSPANSNYSSSTANAQGHYVGGAANAPMVVACVLIIICFCSIVLIIFLSSRRVR